MNSFNAKFTLEGDEENFLASRSNGNSNCVRVSGGSPNSSQACFCEEERFSSDGLVQPAEPGQTGRLSSCINQESGT